MHRGMEAVASAKAGDGVASMFVYVLMSSFV